MRTIPVAPPYDFGLYPKLFIHAENAFLPFHYSPTKWTRLIDFDDETSVPVSVTCRYSQHPELCIAFLTDISDNSLRALERKIASSFCADVDLKPLYHKALKHALLRQLVKELNGLRPHLSLEPFESLIKVIVRQVVRATTAQRLIDNLVRKFGGSLRIGDDTYYSFPTPETLASARKNELLDCRIGYKWEVIRTVSREVARGNLEFNELKRLDNETIIDILTDFKWIGPWTSRVFLYDGLHRLDAYPEFDISIRRAAARLHLKKWVNDYADGKLPDLRLVWGVMVSYLFGSLWTDALLCQPKATVTAPR